MSIVEYVTDSQEALDAMATPEPKNIWIDGMRTVIYTGEDYTPDPVGESPGL